MSLVPVREYASADEMMAAYRARLRPAAPIVVIPVARPAEPPPVVAPKSPRLRQWCAWSADEVTTLREMAAEGYSIGDIARRLHRSAGGIADRAKELGIEVPRRRRVWPADRAKEATELYRLVYDRPAGGSIKALIGAVAESSGLTREDIFSDSRTAPVVSARQRAMWLAAKETTLSLAAIGRMFGRDHTTVMAAIKRENERTATNVRGLGLPKRSARS